MERSNGCETGGQNKSVLVRKLEPRKKEAYFQGEVFFLLTRPLMGDPII